jgi:hypothetical protein
MNDNHNHPSDPPVQTHPTTTFDVTEGQTMPAGFRESKYGMMILAPVPFDLSEAAEIPFLKLTLYLRPDADPATLSLDVLRLMEVINRYDRDLGGNGMVCDAIHSKATPGSGVVRLVLTPNEMQGAQGRLAQLAAIVSALVSANPREYLGLSPSLRSFARWEASFAGTV